MDELHVFADTKSPKSHEPDSRKGEQHHSNGKEHQEANSLEVVCDVQQMAEHRTICHAN